MIMTPSDRFDTFAVGQHATSVHRVTSTDVVLYAAVTGDLNPVHVDEPHAAASRFGGRIAHGMLSMGFVSALIARALPGPGAIYLSQSVRFLRPVRVGDVISVRVEIVEVLGAKRRLRLATTCHSASDELLSDGEAVVLVPLEG